MEELSKKIRVGSGDFNDIVVKNKEALSEHLHIIIDMAGCHLYRVHQDAKVYINGKETDNRYVDISENDEVRIGEDIVDYKDFLRAFREQIEAAKMAEEEKKNERKEENRVALSYLVNLIIYFGLGFFFLWSIFEGKKLLIIISAILFSVYLIGGIILNLLNRKYESETERKARIRFRIITLIIMIPFLFRMCSIQKKYDALHEKGEQRLENLKKAYSEADSTNYYRVVYNNCDHDVTISYRKKRGSIDSVMSYQIAKGAFDTIALSADFVLNSSTIRQAGSTGKVSTLGFAYDGVTITYGDGSSIIHRVVGRNGNTVDPEEHNILSISSWEKDEDQKVAKYTLTPEDLYTNTSLKTVTVKN